MVDLRCFLLIATQHLKRPIKTTSGECSDESGIPQRRSWCSWTTYGRLSRDAGYWTGELPLEAELGDNSVSDGGTWVQPFYYKDNLAHIIIPRIFTEEHYGIGVFRQWQHEQDIDGLSLLLHAAGIDHYLSQYALEVKLF
ncbi:hypothetical protein ACFOKF_10760 [Sphingobium rhizovicinum]|uniref:Uncharacterized protein n=1 Tax=Sphingobium rhizovicinum TaxID=432308 RepID=A0ABV7NGQ2_9SPHN